MIARELVFTDRDERFRVVLEFEPVGYMFRLCAVAKRRETGGVLVGRYSDDLSTARVMEATSPPPDSRGGRDWFERGVEGLASLLRSRWEKDPRTHYLGEWHFHTANVPWPSGQDARQMHALAADPAYRCVTPLLAIACPAKKKQWKISMYVFPGGAGPFELSLLPD